MAAAAPAAAGERGPVVVGIEGARPPFHFVDSDNKLKGLEIEIVEAICARLARGCSLRQTDWEDLVPSLEAERIDMITSTLEVADIRKQRLAASAPLYAMPFVFVSRKEGLARIANLDALRGKTIGVLHGARGHRFVKTRIPEAAIRTYPTVEDALLDLSYGRIDAVLARKDVAADWLNGTDTGPCCAFAGDAPGDEMLVGRGVALALRLGDTALKAEIDRIIGELRADGTLRAITDRYFLFRLM